MNGVEWRRLRAPLVTVGCGLAIAIAVAVAAGWAAAVPVAAICMVAALVYYMVGGTDSDVGALIGSRADERQSSVRLRVRAGAAVVLLVVGAIGGIVSASLARAAWPYAVTVSLGAFCFFVGLAAYGRGGRIRHIGFPSGPSRLDERQSAVLLYALQLAGIVMFIVAAVAGVALSGRAGADSFRVLALVFAVCVLGGFAVSRPRSG